MEMIDKLITEIRTIADFSAADIELFLGSFTEKVMDKGDHFLMEGQVSKHLGYIKNGLTMHYRIVDGIEIPVDFALENEWVAYLKSFTTGTVSDMSIKALEPTHLLTMSSAAMDALFTKQPKFVALRSYYTERSFIRQIEHAANLATLNAKQRYYQFMKDHPALINRVPQYYIAAYLGIKPQSLSRLRK